MSITEIVAEKQELQAKAIEAFKAKLEKRVSRARALLPKVKHALIEAEKAARTMLHQLDLLEGSGEYLSARQAQLRRYAQEALRIQRIPGQIEDAIRAWSGVSYDQIRDFNTASETESSILSGTKGVLGAIQRADHLRKQIARALREDGEG